MATFYAKYCIKSIQNKKYGNEKIVVIFQIMTNENGNAPLFGSCRLVLTIMVFFGVYHLMSLRFNLSMALGKECNFEIE